MELFIACLQNTNKINFDKSLKILKG